MPAPKPPPPHFAAALLFPTTWESRHAASFWRRFGMEVVGCVLSLGLSLAGSYWALGSSRAARAVRGTLLAKAARAQSLLETAMPPTVAQALLGGTPAYELSRAFGSATVAFIALDDFCDKEAEGNPTALLAWLNAVYAAFDGLVDAYGDRINKIEVRQGAYTPVLFYSRDAGLFADRREHVHCYGWPPHGEPLACSAGSVLLY